jgi:uncharacterized protein (TIGR00725 family)
MHPEHKKIIGVIGAGCVDESAWNCAEEVGRLIAGKGAILVCGGLGGVMKAAAKGTKSVGGITVGILPHATTGGENPYIDIPVATGFGEGRNVIIVRTADVLIAVYGEYGTLSEIALALKMGKPVIGIHTWDIQGVIKADSAEDAVQKAFQLI